LAILSATLFKILENDEGKLQKNGLSKTVQITEVGSWHLFSESAAKKLCQNFVSDQIKILKLN